MPSRDPGMSLSFSGAIVDCSSDCFWVFFLFFLRSSFENPLEPALAVSGASPGCDLGLSKVESIDERPLLRPELSIVSKSGGTVWEWLSLLVVGTSEEDGAGGSSLEEVVGLSIMKGKEGKRRSPSKGKRKVNEQKDF